MTLSSERRAECAGVLESARRWVVTQESVRGLALVGSWARDRATMTSDVDLVVLSDDAAAYREGEDWIEPATGTAGSIVRSRMWGPMCERRVALTSGLVVEFGFAPTGWTETKPVDEGTARVVRDGMRIMYDPGDLFQRLVVALGIEPRWQSGGGTSHTI